MDTDVSGTVFHGLVELAWKRCRAGSGSDLWGLLDNRELLRNDLQVRQNAAFGDVPHAVIGAVASNYYMPPRHVVDIDFAILLNDEVEVNERLFQHGWRRGGKLGLRFPLHGWKWRDDRSAEVDVVSLPGVWGVKLIHAAMENMHDQLPIATLPYLTALKVFAGRAIDVGDVARMLGHQREETLELIREVAGEILEPAEMEDLDRLIEMSRLEYGSPPVGIGE